MVDKLRFSSWGPNSSLIGTLTIPERSLVLYLIPCTKKFEGKWKGNAKTRVARKTNEIFSKSLSQNGTPLKVPGYSQSLYGVHPFQSLTGDVVLIVIDVAPVWI
jgi:hypothetical protein